ncbi:MAG: serine/threonine-protein phosphatase [Nocardiopsaceae bacterium]|nr:serine/threonine-protein phosphatase [Nocardiopsaceae bacterium]
MAASGDVAPEAPDAGLPGRPWFGLLDELAESVLALRPIQDRGGRLTDFAIIHLSPGYVDPAGREPRDLAGLTLLRAYPGSACEGGLFARAAQVLADGRAQRVPGEAGPLAGPASAGTANAVPVADLRAAPCGDCVVFTWRRLADDDARLAEEHELSLRLQRAIMPGERHVDHDGLDVAVRYRPAEAGYLVAGDWYDTLEMPGGDLLLIVGDIAGHGIAAVTGMVTARNALRGLAATGARPGELLGQLNYAACVFTKGITGTVVCGRYDPCTRVLRWARAGHLPPILVRDGVATVQPAPDGMLIGVTQDARFEELELQLRSGDTLLLYTDGLIERRAASISDALAEFAAVAVPVDPDADSYAARVMEDADSDTGDDACLVAVRIL